MKLFKKIKKEDLLGMGSDSLLPNCYPAIHTGFYIDGEEHPEADLMTTARYEDDHIAEALLSGNPLVRNTKQNAKPQYLCFDLDMLSESARKRIASSCGYYERHAKELSEASESARNAMYCVWFIREVLQSPFRACLALIVHTGNKGFHFAFKTEADREEDFAKQWSVIHRALFGFLSDSECDSTYRTDWRKTVRRPQAINTKTGRIQKCYYCNPEALSLPLFQLEADGKPEPEPARKREWQSKDYSNMSFEHYLRNVCKTPDARRINFLAVLDGGDCGGNANLWDSFLYVKGMVNGAEPPRCNDTKQVIRDFLEKGKKLHDCMPEDIEYYMNQLR